MLEGDTLRRWQRAIVEVYDEAELRVLVRSALDVELDEVSAGDLRTRVWDLLTWAERHGQLDGLLGAIAIERPQLTLETGEGMEQRQFTEGNGVQRTVGQLEANMVQVNDRLRSMEEQIRFLRWWIMLSTLLSMGFLGYHVWV